MANKKKKSSLALLAVLFLLVSALMLPTFVFVFVAMLPSVISIVTDRANYGYKWVCIMGLNLAGMLPYLFDLWMGVHDMVSVIDILTDVSSMVVIYGCAMMGWLLYVLVPPIIVSTISISDKNRVRILKKKQEMLIKKWGAEVVGEDLSGDRVE